MSDVAMLMDPEVCVSERDTRDEREMDEDVPNIFMLVRRSVPCVCRAKRELSLNDV